MKYALKWFSSCLLRNKIQWKVVMSRVPGRNIVYSFIIGCFVFLVLVSVPNGSISTIDDSIIPRLATVRQDSYDHCVPKEHIMFLKTHKCGSSTVQNILLRFGYRKNLTFALPDNGNYIGSPKHFKASMIPKSTMPVSGLVDIFCVHTRMEESELKKVLYNDTVWVTILRDPVSLYESLFSYYRLSYAFEMELEGMITKSLEELSNFQRTKSGKFGFNQMLYDLGAEPNITVVNLQRKLSEISRIFDLVLIVERMEESLILLKELLCWTMEDVIAFTKNARGEEFKKPLKREVKEKLRDLNSADVLLYNYFLAKHKEKVLNYGVEKMAREVNQLKALVSEYYKKCVYKKVTGRDSNLEFPEYSYMVNSYLVSKNNTKEMCKVLTIPELPFVSIVRDHQKKVLLNLRGRETGKSNRTL